MKKKGQVPYPLSIVVRGCILLVASFMQAIVVVPYPDYQSASSELVVRIRNYYYSLHKACVVASYLHVVCVLVVRLTTQLAKVELRNCIINYSHSKLNAARNYTFSGKLQRTINSASNFGICIFFCLILDIKQKIHNILLLRTVCTEGLRIERSGLRSPSQISQSVINYRLTRFDMESEVRFAQSTKGTIGSLPPPSLYVVCVQYVTYTYYGAHSTTDRRSEVRNTTSQAYLLRSHTIFIKLYVS